MTDELAKDALITLKKKKKHTQPQAPPHGQQTKNKTACHLQMEEQQDRTKYY